MKVIKEVKEEINIQGLSIGELELMLDLLKKNDRAGNNLDNVETQKLHLEPLKLWDVGYESTSYRRCLDRDVHYGVISIKWKITIKGNISANQKDCNCLKKLLLFFP